MARGEGEQPQGEEPQHTAAYPADDPEAQHGRRNQEPSQQEIPAGGYKGPQIIESLPEGREDLTGLPVRGIDLKWFVPKGDDAEVIRRKTAELFGSGHTGMTELPEVDLTVYQRFVDETAARLGGDTTVVTFNTTDRGDGVVPRGVGGEMRSHTVPIAFRDGTVMEWEVFDESREPSGGGHVSRGVPVFFPQPGGEIDAGVLNDAPDAVGGPVPASGVETPGPGHTVSINRPDPFRKQDRPATSRTGQTGAEGAGGARRPRSRQPRRPAQG